jgi:hypothetical protein
MNWSMLPKDLWVPVGEEEKLHLLVVDDQSVPRTVQWLNDPEKKKVIQGVYVVPYSLVPLLDAPELYLVHRKYQALLASPTDAPTPMRISCFTWVSSRRNAFKGTVSA